MNLTWQKVAAIVTVITIVGGSSFAVERYFAKQKPFEELTTVVAKSDEKYVSIEDFLAMNKRITLNSLEDRLYKKQQRLWQYEDRYLKTKDVTLLRIIKELKDEIKILNQKIYNLETK